ncbi:bifunctional adenosylcobinamide kinase/adenosylcobinamide-phosphate guanylyltransferase [Paenibacillus hamazuiensis]|uniref:bifunctional adenosylcobinamide kinase/adenosylcobinamide-phosphate guanylyltransferase n=1 Tax=Paenibacillus hamazuiensis TaxID=2936508 RepID=UPI00200CBC26|nr:bifunctional adenosylcobinamide kinase/adenosylcobinamide-phosphate guanylyltransferase [Paenibacillus hamazuiensis]
MLRETSSDPAGRGGMALVTGGARSGKSGFAERYAAMLAARSGGPVIYIATSQLWDEEMERRAALHRERRPKEWRTIEAPYDLENAIAQLQETAPTGTVLIDCVTMWISNLLLEPGPDGEERWAEPEAEERILQRVKKLADRLRQAPFSSVLVTNEVGHALVPEYPLGRVFRDIAGQANQTLAQEADDVFYVVCGMPLNLRQMAWRPEGADPPWTR